MERWQVETAVGGRCAVGAEAGAEAGAEPVEGLWKACGRPGRDRNEVRLSGRAKCRKGNIS